MGEYLTPKEVAEILKVSYETALAVIKYGGIEYLQIGRQYRVSKKKFHDFFSKNGTKIIDVDDRYF